MTMTLGSYNPISSQNNVADTSIISGIKYNFFSNRLYVGKYVIHCFSHLFTRPPKLSSFSGRLTVIQRTKVDDIAAMTQNNSPKKKF